MVVAAVSGVQKAAAVLGALRGGYIDVLVIDDKAVDRLLIQAGIETPGVPG